MPAPSGSGSGSCSWPTRSNSTRVGLEEVGDGIWSLHFCHVLLGRVDERDYIIRP
jgi:hypothetical protein